MCSTFQQQSYAPGCYSPCFTASCSFSAFLCRAPRASLASCPLFDAAVYAAYAAQPQLAFADPASLRGAAWNASGDGLYAGYARCVAGAGGDCRTPGGAGAPPAFDYGPDGGAGGALLLGTSALSRNASAAQWVWTDASEGLTAARAAFAVEVTVRVDTAPYGGTFAAIVSSEGFSVGAVSGSNGTAVLALQVGASGTFACASCQLPRGQWVRVAVSLVPAAAQAVIHVGGNRTDFQLPAPGLSVPTALAGPWGLAVGRQLPTPAYLTNMTHVEDDNSSRFNGAVAALRLWGREFDDAANASAGAAAGTACGTLSEAGGLVACYDFLGSLNDSAGRGVNLSARVGDRFRPWCTGVDDDGKVLQHGGGKTTTMGEAWGFCPAPGARPTLPSAGRNYDPTAMMALARSGSLAEVVAAYPGCGRVLLAVRGNRAGKRGGGIFRDSCDFGSSRRGLCFVDGNAPAQAPAQQVLFERNVAGVAGGAVYVECSTIGAACLAGLNATLALPLRDGPPPRIFFSRNGAGGPGWGNGAGGWGGDVGTAPARIAFAPGEPNVQNRSYIPGIEAINFNVVLYDGLGALIRGSDSVARSRVCSSATSGVCLDDAASLTAVSFVPFDPATGRAAVAGGAPLVCTGGAASSIVQFSVMGASLSPLVVSVSCLSCPPTSSRRNEPSGRSWRCVPCRSNQFVVDSNNPAHTCRDCPAGAICNGSSLFGALEGSVWVVDLAEGQYRLTRCPAGFRLQATDSVTGRFSFVSQRCVACGMDQFIIDTVSPNATCLPCPVGAVCNGSVLLRGLVEDSVWVLDDTAGQYRLTRCPAGYRLQAIDSNTGLFSFASQRCVSCEAGKYIIDTVSPNATCLPCPVGAICNGSSLAGLVEGSMWGLDDSAGQYRLIRCPAGYRLQSTDSNTGLFSFASQRCVACGNNEYIIDTVSSTSTCLPCPIGAFCNGSSLAGLVEGSVWVLDDSAGQYRLTRCPAGYRLQSTDSDTGLFSFVSQRCVACGAGKYIIDTVSPTATCLPCPVGAACNGSSLAGLVEGSVWVLDNSAGQYRLTRCPAGYRLQATDSITNLFSFVSQHCMACGADQYIVDTVNPNVNCQPCPVGATCNGSSLRGLVNGSLWEVDPISGQYVLQACPAAYEFVNLGPSGVFSHVAQQCRLCAPGYYCPGGISSAIQCPAGNYAPRGSPSVSSCRSAVFVSIGATMPLLKVQFTVEKQQTYVSALAQTVKVAPDDVTITSITQNRRAWRRAGAPYISILSQVATKESGNAAALVSALDPDLLNFNLVQAGLPSVTLRSAAVVVLPGSESSQGSMTLIGAIVGSLGAVFLMAAAVGAGYRIHTRPASRRLMGAEAGVAAGQHDLPFELRGKYEAVKVLGSGGFGVVLEAWQMSTIGRRTVRRAVKLVHCTGRKFSSHELRRLDREVLPNPPPSPIS